MGDRLVLDDGVGLNVVDQGPAGAPVVLFAHSVGCDLTLWDEQAAALSARWRVLRYDSRGHGASDAPEGDYSVERLALDAVCVLDAAGIGRAHLCGLSLGGSIAMWLAQNRPERLASIALCDTAARLGAPQTWQSRIDAVRSRGMEPIADLSMSRFFCDAFRQSSPEVVGRFRRGFVETPAEGYAGCCAALRDADLTAGLATIVLPTLVVGGLQDFPTPPRDAEHLARAIPGASLTMLATGHLSNIEDPSGFNAALVAHLRACPLNG